MPMPSTRLSSAIVWVAAALLTGCAAPRTYDYTALKQAKPRSILVLPPVNESLDIKATHSLLAHSSQPLAEAGYYVLPVALVDETFRQNGLTQARVFADVVEITGVVLTKLDGTAKGGIVFRVQQELGVPVKLVGLGEGPDDLAPFEPAAFVDALLG